MKPLLVWIKALKHGTEFTHLIAKYSRKLVDHHYFQTHEYEAPGIAVFMFDNATFVSCERSYYYNDTE